MSYFAERAGNDARPERRHFKLAWMKKRRGLFSSTRMETCYSTTKHLLRNRMAATIAAGHPMPQTSEQFDPTVHFDEGLAAKYDRRIRLFCPGYDALHEAIVHLLQPMMKHSSVLSAGAGTGADIVNLGKRFPSWRFVGVDVSPDMLAACRQRVAESGIADRVDLFNGRMQDYRSPVLFDAASSVFVAHFIKDRGEKLGYFRSIAANLKPGGLLVVADLFGDKESGEFERLSNAWLQSYASHGISPEEFARDKEHIARDVDFVPEAELAALLRKAGFATPIRFYQVFLFGGWVATKNL